MRSKLIPDTVIWFDPADDGSFRRSLRIIGCIGEGGTGIIYTAKDDDGIIWAVKESFPNTGGSVYRKPDGSISAVDRDLDNEINRILENESEVAISLQNDLTNDVMAMPFYSGILKGTAIQCPGKKKPVICSQLFTRMQYIKGITADKAVFNDTLGRLRAIKGILKAIAKIHQAGFILGDIKPGNIMIADDGRCFILDYGSAVKTDSNGRANIDPLAYPRSSGYIGPELFSQTAYLTRAYDVYSLGALLMDLLLPERTGMIREIQYHKRMEYPYYLTAEELETYGAFSKLSIQQELSLSPALSDQLSGILKKCLADDRDMRYQDAEELLTDYSAFLNNYQYRTVRPQKYDYHLLWQASYDHLAERLNDMISGRRISLKADGVFRKDTPEWWKLLPVNGHDSENNCYKDIGSYYEALNSQNVYLYAVKGSGKTLKSCQIMLRKLWDMPVLYADLTALDCDDADELISNVIREQLGYLPEHFIEGMKAGDDRFLIVLDNVNNLSFDNRRKVLRIIADLPSVFSRAEILLVGLNEMIGDDELDGSFRKIRLEGLDQQDDSLLKIPFFYMRYQEMKCKDPEFEFNTCSEVEFLNEYMRFLGVNSENDKILMELAMINSFIVDYTYAYHQRLKKEVSWQDIDYFTGRLGLLVRKEDSNWALQKETDAAYTLLVDMEFAHDKYRDYFVARAISMLITDAIRYGTAKPVSEVLRAADDDIMKMLMEMSDQSTLDRLYDLLSNMDSSDMSYNGLIESFAGYYWNCKDHVVNKWAELGARHDDDLSMAIMTADFITKMTSSDQSSLEKAVSLCRKVIGHYGSWYRGWALQCLGMLVMHDELEKRHYGCYLDKDLEECLIVSDAEKSPDPQRYYRIGSSFGTVEGLTAYDGLRMFYEDDVPDEFKDIACYPSEKPVQPVMADNSDSIRVRKKYWNIIDEEDMRNDVIIKSDDGEAELKWLDLVAYQGKLYEVAVTMDSGSDGIEEIIILENVGLDKEGEPDPLVFMETVDDIAVRKAVFNIFMNEKGGNEYYETVE